MTSVSVIGYGSSYTTIYTRVLLIFLLSIIMVALQDQTTQIMNNISAKSIYMTRKYSHIENVKHIVLLGVMSQTTMKNFFTEYFHEDHGDFVRHCIVMMNKRPSPSMIRDLT